MKKFATRITLLFAIVVLSAAFVSPTIVNAAAPTATATPTVTLTLEKEVLKGTFTLPKGEGLISVKISLTDNEKCRDLVAKVTGIPVKGGTQYSFEIKGVKRPVSGTISMNTSLRCIQQKFKFE